MKSTRCLSPSIVESILFLGKLNDIRSCKASKEEADDFLKLRHSIIQRVEEIDNFFEDNFEEENIHYFEHARLKLKLLLTYDSGLLENSENIPAVDFRVVEFNSNQYFLFIQQGKHPL